VLAELSTSIQTSVNNFIMDFQLRVWTEDDADSAVKTMKITIYNCGKSGYFFSGGLTPEARQRGFETVDEDQGRRLANPNKGGVPRTRTYNTGWQVLWANNVSPTSDGGSLELETIAIAPEATAEIKSYPAS